MRKTLFILSCFTLALASCGGNSESSGTNQDTSTTVTAKSPEPMVGGEKLIAKADCIGCHNKTQKVIGPSYVDIAAKYPSTDKNIEKLADKIIKGGKGNWGELEMSAHADLSKDDAKEMVKYILSLKK